MSSSELLFADMTKGGWNRLQSDLKKKLKKGG